MFEMTRLLFLLYSEHATLLSVIGRRYPVGGSVYTYIEGAHQFALSEFGDVTRLSGERYIRHLESTAIITFLILEGLGIDDPEMIVVALLHDTLEDRKKWTFNRLARRFGMRVAIHVRWVSKRDLKYFKGNKDLQDKSFQQQLEEAPFLAVIIKLADQLHNLMTLWAREVQSQRRKVQFAKEFYLPLAQKHGVLVNEFHFVIPYAELLLVFKSTTGLNPMPKFK